MIIATREYIKRVLSYRTMRNGRMILTRFLLVSNISRVRSILIIRDLISCIPTKTIKRVLYGGTMILINIYRGLLKDRLFGSAPEM